MLTRLRMHGPQTLTEPARIASVRADALHQAASMLAGRYETIVAEDLNVAGMTRNRKLARTISDQG